MKVAILAVLVCVAVSSHAAAVPHVVDWEAVRANIHLLRDGMKGAINQIKDIAVADDPFVGGEIRGKLSSSASLAYSVIGKLEASCKDMTLTQDQAFLAFEELNLILDLAQSAIQPHVALLRAETQESIQALFRTIIAIFEATGQEIITQLEQ